MAIDTVTKLIGGAAGICTTLSFVPQLMKIRRQGGRDLSDGMLALYLLGLALWLAYGIRIKAAEVIGANVVAGTLVIAAVVMKRRSGASADEGGRKRARARTLADADCKTEILAPRKGAAVRQRASMGAHDGASDDVSSGRLQPHGVGRARRDGSADPGPTRHREVGESLYTPALAGRASYEPGARSRRRRNAAERLCRRCGRTRGDCGAVDVTGRSKRLAATSGLRRDVRRRLAPLGLPAHEPPSAPVRPVAATSLAGDRGRWADAHSDDAGDEAPADEGLAERHRCIDYNLPIHYERGRRPRPEVSGAT